MSSNPRLQIVALCQQARATIWSNAAAFTPDLVLVQFDDLFELVRNSSEILARLPAVILQVGDVTAQRNGSAGPNYLEATIPLTANLLMQVPDSGLHRLTQLEQGELLASLLNDDWDHDLPGCEILDVIPSAIRIKTDFQDLDPPIALGWVQVEFQISAAFWTQ